MNKHTITKMIIIIIVTALLGEFRVTPFDSPFRFGLGSAGFFFLLLFYKDVPYLLTGLVTGVCTTLFRISLDYYFFIDAFTFFESLQLHSSIIAYYVTFAFLLQFIKRKDLYQHPIALGLWGTFCDGFSNVIELMVTHFFTPIIIILTAEKFYILLVAIVRSFFVVGLLTIFQANQLNAVYNVQRARYEQLQTILSELYIEVFYLRKTLTNIEDVTAKGHQLYRELKESSTKRELPILALTVAQELHEVKKDNQRILAGLEKLMKNEKNVKPITLSEIIELCVKSNQKYVEYLRKKIVISSKQQINMNVESVYPLFVIINNLVANSVEAVSANGYVKINSNIKQRQLVIEVEDNGVGIQKDEFEVIFEPGYTSKFDDSGIASTGIGLSHVKSMVEELQGNISVTSDQKGTTFTIELPLIPIQGEGVL